MSLKSCNKTDVNTAELIITIDAEAFEKAVEATYNRQKKNISLPGFRKGKVTRKMAEKQFGESCFYEDALNRILPAELDAAIAESNLTLVDRPSVDVTSINKETGVEIKVVCVTKPVVEISDYIGIKSSKTAKPVTDEEIEEQVKIVRKRNARIVSVDDREARMGDEVTIDFKGFFGDEAFEGGEAEDHALVLGSGQFIPGFEEQIVGKNIGEEFDVTVTFPENYQMEDYAGKEAVFKCKLNAISYEELPEIDDELVQDATEFSNVTEYKADVKAKLEEAAQNQANIAFENTIMEALIEKVDCPIPNCMFEKRIDVLISHFEDSLKQNKMTVDKYLQYTGMDMEAFRDTFRERAESEVKLRLALEKIAELENIELTEEEINVGLVDVAAANKVDVETIKRFIPMDDYKSDLIVQKAIEFVKSAANTEDTVEEAAE